MSYNRSDSNDTQNKRIRDLIEISQNESYWNFYGEKLIDSDIELIANELKQLNKNCQVLDLFKNKITSKGVLYLSEMLKVNGTLRILNLRWNQIDDDGAKSLFDVLKDGNRTLEHLHLDLNQITDKSVESILKMINANRTLKLLILTDNRISEDNQRHLEKVAQLREPIRLNVRFC
jgi:Ran GTPase-activating protein (RanGAP) involved in mRNA processing and transport